MTVYSTTAKNSTSYTGIARSTGGAPVGGTAIGLLLCLTYSASTVFTTYTPVAKNSTTYSTISKN